MPKSVVTTPVMVFQHHTVTYIIKPTASLSDGIFTNMPLLPYCQILETKVYIKPCMRLFLGMEAMPLISTFRRLKQENKDHKFETNMGYTVNWRLSPAS